MPNDAQITSFVDERVQRDGQKFWWDTSDEWMFDDVPDSYPMAVDGTIPMGVMTSLPGMGKLGKTYAAAELLGKTMWPGEDGETWMGRKVMIEGPCVFVTKEESRRSMTLMFRRLGLTDRRLNWEARNPYEKRIYMKHQGESLPLIVSDKTGVYETQFFKEMRRFMIDLKPAFGYIETLSKMLLIELNDRGQMSQGMDIMSELSSSSSMTGILATHVNKNSTTSDPDIKTNEQMRSLISGSAAFVDGLRHHTCLRRAHRDLGEMVVAHGLADNRFKVICLSTVGNFDECRETEMLPRVLVRHEFAKGYEDITQRMIELAGDDFQAAREGIKFKPKAQDGDTPRRGRGRPKKDA